VEEKIASPRAFSSKKSFNPDVICNSEISLGIFEEGQML
jgi:hypothetical protein